jgi:uncharacterized protein (DUF2252 family)
VARAAHADWAPAAERPDPVALLARRDRSRLADFVPIRYGRMLASPFAFLRGAASIMADDLSRTAVTGLGVQAAGDAHLLNFGVFGTEERNLVFGINDFDETLPGPWEWDVKRLAASGVVAAREVGASQAQAAEAARAAVRSYRTRIREYAAFGGLDLWYTQVRAEDILPALHPRARVHAQEWLRSARKSTNLQVLEKATEVIDGSFRIIDHPPLIVHAGLDQHEALQRGLDEWSRTYRLSLLNDRRVLFERYALVDVARKVVGVGSVGTRCFVALFRGEDDRDPLFLQMKQALPSVLEPYLGRSGAHHGRRVVDGQRLIQPSPDVFLGWGSARAPDGGRLDFYVRQLRDMKGSASADPDTMRPGGLPQFTALCGWALALAHARSGDAPAIGGYLGPGEAFDEAIVRFAVAYADQTERDHAALVAAWKAGKIRAETGV